MRASRSSHSTVSKGWTPGVVKRRRIDSAFAAWTSCAIWGANSIESLLLLPRFPGVCGVRSGGLDGPRIVHLTADGTAWAPCGKRFPLGYSAGGRTPRRRRLPRHAATRPPCPVPARRGDGRLRRRQEEGGRPDPGRAQGGRGLRPRPGQPRRRGRVRRRHCAAAQADHRCRRAGQSRGRRAQLWGDHDPDPALAALRPARPVHDGQDRGHEGDRQERHLRLPPARHPRRRQGHACGGPVAGLLLRTRARVTAAAPWPRAEPLSTQRLVLEPLRPDHARELAAVLADPALHAFTGGQPAEEDELRARFTRQAAGRSPDGAQGWLNWVARDRATHAPVGTVQATVTDDAGVRTAVLGWVVATSRQGEGLATEAARAARDWLREHGVTRFAAHIHPDHAASAAVARHLGLAATDERWGGEVRWVGA